jgi:hypothetical protein
MADPQPHAAGTPAPRSNAPVVLRIILAILLLVPGIVGVAVLGALTGAWIYEGFRFLDSDRPWMPLFIVPSVILILFSVLTVGIVLRFARWQRARQASLVLAAISASAIVIGYQLMLDCFPPGDTESLTLTLVGAILGLLVASLPPFLHWWNGRAPGAGG